jgi:hypothetical protein
VIVYLSGFGDWAGMGAHMAEASRRTGQEAVGYAKYQHKFGYLVKDKLWGTYPSIKELQKAEVVILMHTAMFQKGKLPIDSSRQLIGAFHGGPPFRGKEKSFIERMKKKFGVHFHLIQTPEMYVPGDSNYLLEGLVDTDYLQPVYHNGKHRRLIFAHYPRPTGNGIALKGTASVVAALTPASFASRITLLIDKNQKTWVEHMKRVSKCDVYIEKISKTAEFGMSALEAAALGKIVITQNEEREEYEKLWGKAPILRANNVDELRGVVNDILSWSKDEILEKQKESRKWVKNCHSMRTVGKRLNRIFRTEAAKNNLIFSEGSRP